MNNTCVASSLAAGFGRTGYVRLLFTVPTGKQLVVETVGYTLSGTLRSPLKMALFAAYLNLGSTLFPLLETDPKTYTFYSPPSLGSFLTYSNTHATKFYLNENESLVAGAQFLGPPITTPAEQVFIFSGYLVDQDTPTGPNN